MAAEGLMNATPQHPNDPFRADLARELQGSGIEFGPGVHPLPLGPFVRQIRYVDRFDRDSFAQSFPETAAARDHFPSQIDFRLNCDSDPFVERIGAASVDFAIANHLLEHLVNPIRFLEQVFAILKPAGRLFIALPDKRHVFDRDRPRTPLADVIGRYQGGETTLSDQRIIDFVRHVDPHSPRFGPGSANFADEVAVHRQRSIHVNVWLVDDVIELFLYLGRNLGTPWELLDGHLGTGEYLLLFRKTSDPSSLDRYPLVLQRLYAERHQRRLEAMNAQLIEILHVMDERVRETQNFLHLVKRGLRRLPGMHRLERWRNRTR